MPPNNCIYGEGKNQKNGIISIPKKVIYTRKLQLRKGVEER